MLITRPKNECIEGIRHNHNSNFELGSLVGGQVESAEACGASGWLLRTRGSRGMNLEDVIERNSRKSGSGVVFVGTTVPIKLLFEFLEDDQTLDTFLDQFPMVSRDQVRAVLSASLKMLLSTAGSEI